MVDVSYNSTTNTLSWNYGSPLNFLDIYKIENGNIAYSISDISFNNSGNNYYVDVSFIHLMGEQGITNANPFLLNTSSSLYQLGLSGPGTTFFTTNTITINDYENITDISGIPTYDSLTNTIYFYYANDVSGVDLYQVSVINNRRNISASAQPPFTSIQSNFTIDLSGVLFNENQLSISNGVYYLGIKPVNNIFTISGFFNIETNSISGQWDTVLKDNIRLMKAGLYNTSTTNSYHYIYQGEEPTDLSNYPFVVTPPSTLVSLSSTEGNTLYFNPGYTAISLDNTNYINYIGINNSICEFQIGTAGNTDRYIRTDSNYITISEGDGYYKEFYADYNIVNNPGTITVVNTEYVAQYEIYDIIGVKNTPSLPDNEYSNIDIIISNKVPLFYTGQNPQSLYTAGDSANQRMLLNYQGNTYSSDWILPNTITQVYSVVGDNLINATPPLPSYPSTYYVLRVDGSTHFYDTDISGLQVNTLQLQWGYDSNIKSLKYGINYKKGPCKLLMNIPTSGASGFESAIYVTQKVDSNNAPETLLGSFVISNQCAFENVYVHPAKTLDLIQYTDLSGITSCGYYIPSMIPGGDYKIVNNGGNPHVYFMPGSETKMTADRCRQPWRLSHYVRANYPNGTDRDDEVIKIAYNTAAALVYNASMDTGYLPKPGRITLNVDMCNLMNQYNGYSGDMVPPLLALIDALDIHGYSGLETEITNYSNAIKGLNGSTGNNLTNLIDALNNNSSETYPILDSISSGGQQLGLAGCGFVCTQDFLSRPNFDVMLKYDSINSWNTYDTDKYSGFRTKALAKTNTFSDTDFANLIQIYKMSATRGNGFDTYDTWAQNIQSTTNYADAILSTAYITNLRIRGINIDITNELKFGPDSQAGNPAVTISVNSYAASNFDPGCTSPYDTTYVYTDFPMIGIPDSGWGSLTVEIFSYLGIVFAAMNDYRMFCKWHRALWHMLFIQNGGDMYGWATDGTIEKQDSSSKILSANMWLPSYLKAVDSSGSDQTWLPNVINKNQIHYFTIYKWPPENYYGLGSNTQSKTKIWANRLTPYRGDDDANLPYRWSTPSYCMGFSPAWVAGGKTTKTDDWNDDMINRPIAEALNPFFVSSLGLYSATDGDQNILQAYLLASLQWPNDPSLNTFTGLNGDHSPTPPVPGSVESNSYGFNCDVCDFQNNMDISSNHTQYINSGVKWATRSSPYSAPESATITENGTTKQKTFYVTDKIGYGITYDGVWKYPTDNSGNRCTTWAYIAESIQKTIISKNGCGFSGDFGNFAPLPLVPSINTSETGSRFETLGHDTNASDSTTKLDYIDTRLYQICKNLTL